MSRKKCKICKKGSKQMIKTGSNWLCSDCFVKVVRDKSKL